MILVSISLAVAVIALGVALFGLLQLRRSVIPLDIHIDERVPIALKDPLRVPLDAVLAVGFEQEVHVEGMIPVTLQIPLDTVVETSVLGLGSIKIPIKAMIPLSVVIPISSPIRVNAKELTIAVHQTIDISLPPFEVPLVGKLKVGVSLPRR